MTSIAEEFDRACDNAYVKERDRNAIHSFLAPLKEKSTDHYEHCLRVGILAGKIAAFKRFEPRPPLMAGALHDLGKCQCRPEVLEKTEGWTKKDTNEISGHVLAGYRMLRGRLDFSAEVMVLHHRFQPDGYPKRLPRSAHQFSPLTRSLIKDYGRIVALADVFDALRRANDRFGTKRGLSPSEIREKMFDWNTDQRKLLIGLYSVGILY